MHKHPHGGKMNTTDITAADVHSLCDVYNHIVVRDPEVTFVLFHLDYTSPDVVVTPERGEKAQLTVCSKTGKPVFIRIPLWAKDKPLSLCVNGEKRPCKLIGQYLRVEAAGSETRISLSYELPERITRETTNGVEYTLGWKGDMVTGISPNAEYLPFYADL